MASLRYSALLVPSWISIFQITGRMLVLTSSMWNVDRVLAIVNGLLVDTSIS